MTYASEVLADSPAAYLAAQETAGTTLADSSGNSHPATAVNGPVLNDATDPSAPIGLGSHVRLDGTDDHLLLDASTTWFTPASGFTWEAWFYIRSWVNWNRLFDFANAASFEDMYFTSNNAGGMTLKVNGTAITMSRLTVAAWHHVVVTVTSAGAATVYDNASSFATGTVGAPVNGARAYKYIGRSAFSDPYLAASMTQVAVYNSVLSPARVSAHYSAGLGSGSPTFISVPQLAVASAAAQAPTWNEIIPVATDTSNAGDGRSRGGLGLVTMTYPVVAVPGGRTLPDVYDKVMAYPTPTMVKGRPT